MMMINVICTQMTNNKRKKTWKVLCRLQLKLSWGMWLKHLDDNLMRDKRWHKIPRRMIQHFYRCIMIQEKIQDMKAWVLRAGMKLNWFKSRRHKLYRHLSRVHQVFLGLSEERKGATSLLVSSRNRTLEEGVSFSSSSKKERFVWEERILRQKWEKKRRDLQNKTPSLSLPSIEEALMTTAGSSK